MRKIVPFCAAVSAAFLLGNNSALATATVNLTGSTTSPVLLTTKTETFTLAAGGSLTVPDPGPAITINSGNTSPVTATLSNLGTIEQGTGTGTADYAIYEDNGSSAITINNGSASASSALIKSDGSDAIHFSRSSDTVTINNYGEILSVTGGQAVDMSGMTSGATTSTINNYVGGLLEGGASDAVQTEVNEVIDNDGQILAVGSTSDGVNAGSNSGLTITNSDAFSSDTSNTGSITGGHHGITGGNTGTYNGTLQTTPTTSATLGSYVGTGTFTMTITNNTGGTITGNDGSGINIDGFGIQGTQIAGTSNYRLVTNENVTVTNHGTITGYGADRDGDGIDIDGDVIIDNFGTIQSENAVPEAGENGPEFSEGVTVGGGSITNEVGATIHGYVQPGNTEGVGRGITLAGIDKAANDTAIPLESIYENSTITNSGTIQGGNGPGKAGGESGIAVLGTTGGGYTVTITNNAAGTIEGNNSGVSEDSTMSFNGQTVASGQSLNQGAIELDDSGNTYVINEMGKIIQDNANGTAIEMHSAVSNTLNITGGSASITGDIAGDTAADSVLNISPGAGNSFSYGYKISGFTVNVNADGKNGTVTLSGANAYTGTTTVEAGTLNVANTIGSGTGTGKVAVSAGATLGGTGTIQPGAGNGITLAKSSTLVSGGAQSGTTAGAGLTLDNTVAQGVVLDASLGSATLAFSLGANHSATTMTVLGNTAKELSFASTDTFALTDLNNDALTSFSVNTPYVLIQAGTVTGLLADDYLYNGLTTTGGTDGSGNALDGYVTSPVSITLNGVDETGKLQLFLNHGALEVVPEPGTWAMMLGGLGVLVVIQLRRKSKVS